VPDRITLSFPDSSSHFGGLDVTEHAVPPLRAILDQFRMREPQQTLEEKVAVLTLRVDLLTAEVRSLRDELRGMA
jgi:hypothetical protein